MSVLALLARGRAMLLAARGDLDAALASVEEAVRLDEDVPIAGEGARHLLLAGQLHRRRKEKLKARAALEAALAGFEAAGAAGWADRARAELTRVNIRPVGPDRPDRRASCGSPSWRRAVSPPDRSPRPRS